MSVLRAVIDTNVVVAGMLSDSGAPAMVVDLIMSGQISSVFDSRVVHEYEIVLRREKFGFHPDIVADMLGAVRTLGIQVIPHRLRLKMRDENDRCFVECAAAISSGLLITGNKKHFPAHVPGIRVFSPREFIDWFFSRQPLRG